MSSLLDRSANILLIVACSVIIGQLGYRTLHESAPQWKPALPQGERIQGSAALALNLAPRTIVMVTSHDCQFCIASMPFYRKVAGAARARGARVVAVTMEDPAENRKFLESHGITVDKVLSGVDAGFQVEMAPVASVDRQPWDRD